MTAESFFIADRYKVINTLSGGMGIVYFCLDTEDNDFPVALKTFKKEFMSDIEIRNRFLREVTVWAELGFHPNIVQAYKVLHVSEDNSVFIILQLIPSPPNFPDPSLRSRLVYGPPMTEEHCLEIALGIIRGMKYASNKIPGLVHRDLKPENILIGVDDQPNITDFGMVGIHDSDNSSLHGNAFNPFNHNFTDVVRGGTPIYMSPEQIRGDHVDLRSDMYSLGCILLEMISGEPAVFGKSQEEILRAHLSGMASAKLSTLEVMNSIKNILLGCLRIDPANRYDCWESIEKDIERVLQNEFMVVVQPDDVPIDVSKLKEFQKAESYLAIGAAYLNIGKYSESIGFFENAGEIAKKENFQIIDVLAIANQGVAVLNQGYFDKAIGLLLRAIDYFSVSGEETQLCLHLGNLGNAYLGLYELDKSQNYLEQSYEMSKKLGDKLNIARSSGNLGNIYFMRGRFDKALILFQEGLAISQKTNDRSSVCKHLASIANVYSAMNEVQKSIEYFTLSLKEARQIGDPQSEGVIYLSLGLLFYKNNKFGEGILNSRLGLEIGRRIDDKLLTAKALGNIATGLISTNQFTEAVHMLEEAIEISGQINARDVHARSYFSLGLLMEVQGNFSSAVKYLRKAVIIFKELNMIEYKLASEHLLELRKKLGLL